MIDAPLALAFTAGLVATVNPCGFAMLPAYLSWYIGTEGGPGDRPATLATRLGRALVVGATVSVGFLVVFVATGALVTAGVRSFIDYVPWVAVIIGVALVGLGVTLLAGREISVALPKPHVTGPASCGPWSPSAPPTPWPRCRAPCPCSWSWSPPPSLAATSPPAW